MMRGGRNQLDTRTGVTQLRDHLIDLMPRQLTALARLGPLSDLDLQYLCINQIVRCHAKASRGNLLDGRIALTVITRHCLTPLT